MLTDLIGLWSLEKFINQGKITKEDLRRTFEKLGYMME
jgi:hypothetical protein